MAQIGKIVLMLLALIGGVYAILMGEIVHDAPTVVASYARPHVPSQWIEGVSPDVVGLLFIVLGLMGAAGAVLVFKDLRKSAVLLLASGFLGFPVSFASSSPIMALISWIAPGALLIFSGMIALATPEKLASSLPLLNSSRQPLRWLGYATYGILIFFFLNIIFAIGYLSTIVILMSSAPGPSNETSIEDALDEGAVAERMGALGEAIYAYDRAIALNASCVEAWYKKGFDLERMGRYEEAIKCYDKVIELNKSFTDAYPPINVLSQRRCIAGSEQN